ncbi:hypothetical protein MHC_01485 [Mycoplasma haemocanis str. Illinois]|uniref:Uncharacterized protein n=1 Tax=Mycoplasma haemocanis (strain Illinois) TaxID=1111676 RepID=H6N691_MYCHN|nr:hypothetical protein [Mycoplasma haemocanis]AEW45163.1 hypothetical protein MHC_01485 [Mycoplasma haemocanis str. Illinois]
MSKLVLGLIGTSGFAGIGAIVAYKSELLTSTKNKEIPTVRETLTEEGYELVSTDDQFKAFFTEFKADQGFMEEVNKHKKDGDNLSSNDEQGRDALKALCASYLDSKNNLKNAIKWCVLRIQDKPLSNSKSWKNIATDDTDKDAWKTAFDNAKEGMRKNSITGIESNTNSDAGYSILKNWCSENKKLPINNENQSLQSNVISWCAS